MINDPMNYDADFVNEKLKLKQRPDKEVLVKVSTDLVDIFRILRYDPRKAM